MIDDTLTAPVVVEDSNQEIVPEQQSSEKPEEPLEPDQEDKAEGDKAPRKKGKGGWQSTIKRLRAENEKLRAAQIVTPPPALDVKPQLNDYKTYDEYQEALTDWKVEVKLAARDEKLTKAQEEAKTREAESTWDSKIESLEEDQWSDYQQLVEDYKDINLRTQLIKSAKESAIGPQILLHLDKNPELFDKLNNKDTSDLTVKRAIRQLEAELSNQKPSVKISKSPPPINPVKKSSPSTVDLSSLATDDYIAARMNRK